MSITLRKRNLRVLHVSINQSSNRQKHDYVFTKVEWILKRWRKKHLILFLRKIDPKVGLLPFQCRKVAFNLGLSGTAFKEMTKFVSALYAAYDGIDASLFEINPVLKTSDNKILAVDSKVALDGNALYRHKDYASLRDKREEDPLK